MINNHNFIIFTVTLNSCHSSGGNQLFRLNEKGQLGVGERCIDVKNNVMTLIYCKLGTVDGKYKLIIGEKKLIILPFSFKN